MTQMKAQTVGIKKNNSCNYINHPCSFVKKRYKKKNLHFLHDVLL